MMNRCSLLPFYDFDEQFTTIISLLNFTVLSFHIAIELELERTMTNILLLSNLYTTLY